MSNSTNDLLNTIDKMVREKTFSLEALNAINDLRGKAEALQSELANEKEKFERLFKLNAQMSEEIAGYKANEQNVIRREGEVNKRELNITELEKKAAVADAKTMTMATVFDSVFRNSKIRETIFHHDVVMSATGGSSYPMNTSNREEVTREEV